MNDISFYGNYSRSFKDKKFAEKMITYWTNFAKYDDPNYSSDFENWEPFVAKSTDMSQMTAVEKMNKGRYLLFSNENIKMITGFSEHKCDFWNYTLDGVKSNAASSVNNVLMMILLSIITISVNYI